MDMGVNTRQVELTQKIANRLIEARSAAGISLENAAERIQVEKDRYAGYESGNINPSLPELEALGYYFGVLPETLWEEQVTRPVRTKASINFSQLSNLRRKKIGISIRQFRLEAGLTGEKLAGMLGISASELEDYEYGEKEIPFVTLESIASLVDKPVKEFFDKKTAIGLWAEQERALIGYQSMPDEYKEFIGRPINRPYLEIAKKLSDLPVDRLRQIAESLLEITL